MSQTKLHILILCTLLTAFSPIVLASTVAVDGMIKQADFIFEGTVKDVQYKYSEPRGSDNVPIPYTFVTYQVISVLKGRYSAAELSLRFFGGPLQEPGQFMMSPNYPLFDEGDHDLLLVTGNTQYECPLVGCDLGRFRYINGQIVNEIGQTIMLDANGQLQTGRTINDKSITEHRIGKDITISRVTNDDEEKEEMSTGQDIFGLEELPQDEAETSLSEESPLNELQADEFREKIIQKIDSLKNTTALDDDTIAFTSADISQPIYLSDINQGAPAPAPIDIPETVKDQKDLPAHSELDEHDSQNLAITTAKAEKTPTISAQKPNDTLAEASSHFSISKWALALIMLCAGAYYCLTRRQQGNLK